jgi:translation initiation factor IF-2
VGYLPYVGSSPTPSEKFLFKMEKERPPIIIILGHIDSGKTSLLNSILGLEFVEEKPGGIITQELKAVQVEKAGKKITFIDTPGHEAFSKMKSQGAKVADIGILVVDGVEGVKQQTKEAIFELKSAKIPFIVVINKIDKLEADPEKVKRELKAEGVLVEDFGGEVPVVKTSAKTKEGIEDLLDLIFLLAEIKKIRADFEKPGEGVIIESFLDSKRGPIANMILHEGKIKTGDFVATQSTFGKIRRMENYKGEEIKEATAGDPIILIGFEKIPQVGEKLKVFKNKEEAQKFIISEKEKLEEIKKEGKSINLILKADSLGSLEATKEVLKNFTQKELSFKILEASIGEITDSDIELASVGNAFIFGFKSKLKKEIKELAQRKKVKIFIFNVIYDLVEELKRIIERVLKPKEEEIEIGKLKVLVEFWSEKNRQIVGGRIIEGRVEKESKIEIKRGEEIIGKGKLINLQRNKKDIEIGKKGEEVGILYEGEGKIEKGDILIFYKKVKS